MNKTVLYEGWQMECCGTEFRVGDSVEWPVFENNDDNYLTDIGQVDYVEDHHSQYEKDELLIKGVVEKISIIYQHYKDNNGVAKSDGLKVVESKEALQWNEGIDDYQFTGFLVKLKDVIVRPITKEEADSIFP